MAALQGAVPPVLDVDVGFLVQLADGGGRNLAAPQCLRDVLHTVHEDACQIHLDDGCLEGHAIEPGHMERDVAGDGGKIPGS